MSQHLRFESRHPANIVHNEKKPRTERGTRLDPGTKSVTVSVWDPDSEAFWIRIQGLKKELKF